jgi:crotonobetainyl-CoA:carnitine CoA-transferase CaiB-like acyl-CoA transferase
MPGPLEGVKIVDISAVLSGPLATMMLADQGAEVTKVEPTVIGDIMRTGPFARGGLCAFFANANRGKRSIAVDVMRPEGRDLVLALARDADVFVQNYRPGAVERMGLSEGDLRAINPKIIYVSISGYGDSGPYRDRRVYDPVIQGLTGHTAVQVNPDMPIPDVVRNVVSDKSSAYTAAQAITAALFARERGAPGQHVEVAMIDASLAFFWPDGMMAHTMVGEGVREGVTLYQMLRLTETSDGHIMYFAAADGEFAGLYRAIGRPDLSEDDRFNSIAARAVPENLAALGEILFKAFHGFTSADLLERLIAEDVPAGPVHSIEAMLEDPQILHNQGYLEREHPVAGTLRQARVPARFSATPAEPGRLAPLHGEHTDEILGELGVEAAERERLRESGVVV